MATWTLGITVSGEDQFDRKTAALSEVNASLPVDIRKVIVQAAERLAVVARRRALEEPVHGPRHTGLRGQVSAGVSVRETQDGAVINTSMPESDEAAIPRGLDEHGWRHPVFGHRDRWVVQHGAFSWFMDSMQDGQDEISNDLERLLNDAADKIGRA